MAWKQVAILAILAILGTCAVAEQDDRRHKRAIGIFNVVKFPNDACDADSSAMNGTCYTQEECSSLSGTASGTCAEGYGVCCVITIGCGESTSENGTFLSQMASTTPAVDTTGGQSCTYTICPRTTSVSRIRLDLTTFIIGDPKAAGEDGGGGGAAGQGANFAIGKCIDDAFAVTGAPEICGINSGQHMIVDNDGSSCVTATFSYGATASSRSYTIQVTQFESTNEMGGPAGCLQFYTGLTGVVNTFNFDAAASSTHLANQHYDVCVRRAVDRCNICWTPVGAKGAQGGPQGTFGVSNAASADGAATNGIDGTCFAQADGSVATTLTDSDDFILIPNGQSLTDAEATTITAGGDKFCGRFLNAAAAATEDGTVCSRVTPFTLTVSFDDYEGHADAAGAAAMESNQEDSGSSDPLGTQGFSLAFIQGACA